MIIVPFLPVHLEGIELQENQAWLTPHLSDQAYIGSLMNSGPSWTACHEGEVIGCGGFAWITDSCIRAWALVSKHAGPHMFSATRTIRCMLEVSQTQRIEILIDADFPPAHRWAKMLGFEREGTLRKFGARGTDQDIYSRIK